MRYYFSKKIKGAFEDILDKTIDRLKSEGFGILTEIDVKETLRKKLGVEFRKYRILGACNPPYAYKALQAEDKIGTMLPCNVIVQEVGPDEVEVAAIDPIASMKAIENPDLLPIAQEVQRKLKNMIEEI